MFGHTDFTMVLWYTNGRVHTCAYWYEPPKSLIAARGNFSQSRVSVTHTLRLSAPCSSIFSGQGQRKRHYFCFVHMFSPLRCVHVSNCVYRRGTAMKITCSSGWITKGRDGERQRYPPTYN